MNLRLQKFAQFSKRKMNKENYKPDIVYFVCQRS